MERHQRDVQSRSHLSSDEFAVLYGRIRRVVELTPFTVFGASIHDAHRILNGHHKNVPYVALALATGA